MKNKRNLWFEEVIIQLNKLLKSGEKETSRKAISRIAKFGIIDERAAEIIRLEKEHAKDK